jgi:putative addiction module killer protein
LLEARIDFGPGWRIYFAIDWRDKILLLIGGSKRTQDRDIERARALWREYETKQKKRK